MWSEAVHLVSCLWDLSGGGGRGRPWWSVNRPQRGWPLGDRLNSQGHHQNQALRIPGCFAGRWYWARVDFQLPVLAASPKITHGRVPPGSTGCDLTQLLHRASCCAEPSPPVLACSPAASTPWESGTPASGVYPCLPVARASSGLVWALLGPTDTP